jgi:hypothetical protein
MEIDKTLRHDKRKITLIILGALIVLLTVTYAYYMFQVGNGSKTNIDITSDTVDRLTFINGDPISLRVNQFTLAEGSSTNVTGSTSSSANLKANSYNTTASSTYNAYFVIDSNTFTYTNGTTPEMLLSITDPTGATVTSITGLTYVTQNGVSGFDITNKDDTYVIASNYAISANNATTGTTQTWNATVTFLNLTTDQTGNEGKKINASLVLQKETMVIADLKYTVATDGTNGLAKSISAGGYDASVSCTQGSATWSNKYWGMVADLSTSAKQKCAITYTTKASKTYLNTMVTGLAGQTTGTGQVVNENGYRYEGFNPNNYVWFNNELWRVIGVFDTTLADGTTTQSLTKIIRANSIGGLAWDKANTNDWSTASLKSLLNGAYLNKQDGTSSGYCYGNSNNMTTNCDYTDIGINDNYRSMIKNITWKLGGWSTNAVTTETMYGYERGTTVYSGRPTSTTGYIGLMYPSDYGYSVLASSCARTTNLSSYNSATCGGKSWLYGQGDEWTQSPNSSNSNFVFNLINNGMCATSTRIVAMLSVPPYILILQCM